MKTAAVVAMLIAPAALAQTTAFTYQGQLRQGGTPANGTFDMRFRAYDALTGGSQPGPTVCVDNVAVSNGVFSTVIDLGPIWNTTSARWLEVEVRQDSGLTCGNSGGFTLLSPRQVITAAPKASSAGTAFSLSSPDGSPTSVVVDNAGYVGVGVAAPSAPLHVDSLSNTTAPGEAVRLRGTDVGGANRAYLSFNNISGTRTGYVGDGGGGDSDVFLASDVGRVVLSTAGTRGLSVSPTGNVEIGSYNFFGNTQLTVLSESTAVARFVGPQHLDLDFDNALGFNFGTISCADYGPGDPFVRKDFGLFGNSGVTTWLTSGDAFFALDSRSAGSTTASVNAEKLTISGLVEIGQASSDYRRVRIGGGNQFGYIYGSYPALGDGIHFGYNLYADQAGSQFIGVTDGGTSRISAGYGTVTMSTGAPNTGLPVDRLHINPTGLVSIGTNPPSGAYRLQVSGSVGASGFFNTSSRRYKRQIESLPPVLDRFLQLRPATFTWDEDHGGGRTVGLIAEEVQALFPECVAITPDGNADSIDYAALTALAVRSMQEQQHRHEEAVADLIARIDRLEVLLQPSTVPGPHP